MKSQFFGKLRAEHLEGKWWELIDGLGFYSQKYDLTLYTPPRFVLDFSSVPRIPLAYFLAGNTGHWESVGHDMGYRWNQLTRKTHDDIFLEAGFVRASMREKQGHLINTGRKSRSRLMTGFVRVFGGFAYKHKPGCLDYRNTEDCENCIICKNYYPLWEQCIIKGYQPEIAKLHEEYSWSITH